MPSPQIKILISTAAVSVVYAFVCKIRLSKGADKLSRRLEKERPDLWSGLNAFARNWGGGHPGIKLLYRRKAVDLPGFDEEYRQLRALERKLLKGLGLGSACIALLLIGTRFWGWAW